MGSISLDTARSSLRKCGQLVMGDKNGGHQYSCKTSFMSWAVHCLKFKFSKSYRDDCLDMRKKILHAACRQAGAPEGREGNAAVAGAEDAVLLNRKEFNNLVFSHVHTGETKRQEAAHQLDEKNWKASIKGYTNTISNDALAHVCEPREGDQKLACNVNYGKNFSEPLRAVAHRVKEVYDYHCGSADNVDRPSAPSSPADLNAKRFLVYLSYQKHKAPEDTKLFQDENLDSLMRKYYGVHDLGMKNREYGNTNSYLLGLGVTGMPEHTNKWVSPIPNERLCLCASKLAKTILGNKNGAEIKKNLGPLKDQINEAPIDYGDLSREDIYWLRESFSSFLSYLTSGN